MAHLAWFLVSIAEFTTSTPACWQRRGSHLEVIAVVTLQGDTVPQRRKFDTSGVDSSSLSPDFRHMQAGTMFLAGLRIRQGAGPHLSGAACSQPYSSQEELSRAGQKISTKAFFGWNMQIWWHQNTLWTCVDFAELFQLKKNLIKLKCIISTFPGWWDFCWEIYLNFIVRKRKR